MLKDYRTDGMAGRERVLVKSIEEKEGNNGKYHRVTLTDGSMELSATVFRAADEMLALVGKVCDVTLLVKKGYVNISGMEEVVGADTSPYIRHAVSDPERLMQWIEGEVEKVKNDDLRMVTQYLLKENRDVFMTMAAGKTMHHNCLNGLLYHVARMLDSAQKIAVTYSLNKDLLCCGVVLHDIGKVREMETDTVGNSTYTVDGNLFGHLYLGPVMVDEACRMLSIDPGVEKIVLLKHMIASHHKLPEYGAVTRPAFKEAYFLSVIDEFDSRAWIFDQALEGMEPGTVSESIIKGLDTYIYKCKE